MGTVCACDVLTGSLSSVAKFAGSVADIFVSEVLTLGSLSSPANLAGLEGDMTLCCCG